MLANEMIVVGIDDLGGISVSVVDSRTSAELGQVFVPCPSGGYGGHELVVSPQERYLALFLYSGQSEVGYELFALQPSLQHLRGLPSVFGEGEAPVFSADDRWLAMMWETYNDWWSDDTPSGSNQERMIDWGELAVQEVPHGEVRCVPIRARVPADWQPDGWTAPTGLRFESAHELRVRTPWGTEPSIPFPPPKNGPIEIG